MKWCYSQHLNASLAELWLALDRPSVAIDFADACLAGAESSNSRGNVVKARRARRAALISLGQFHAAHSELIHALDIAGDLANPGQTWLTLAALGQLHALQHQPDQAQTYLLDAWRIIDNVASGLSDADLRDRFLESLRVGTIRTALGPRPLERRDRKRSRAFVLTVRPMLIVPRRVFVRKCLKPRKVKVAGLIAGRSVSCNRLPSKSSTIEVRPVSVRHLRLLVDDLTVPCLCYRPWSEHFWV